MINLYEETLGALKRHGKTFDNVVTIGNRYEDYIATKQEIKEDTCVYDKRAFVEASKLINYDDGFGGDCVGIGLVIIGDDFYMDREEYDGSICWNYNMSPQINISCHSILQTKEEVCKDLVGRVINNVLTCEDIEAFRRYFYSELENIDTLCVKKEGKDRVLYVKNKKGSYRRGTIETLPISYTPPCGNKNDVLIGELKGLKLNKVYKLKDIMI